MKSVVENYCKAWNDGDLEGIFNLFIEDAEYEGTSQRLRGRAAICEMYQRTFDTQSGRELKAEPVRLKDGTWGVVLHHHPTAVALKEFKISGNLITGHNLVEDPDIIARKIAGCANPESPVPNPRAILVGLTLAWGGPAFLVSPAARVLGQPDRLTTMFLGEAIMWAFAGSVATVVIFWEKQPLSSLGLRRPDWRTIASGFALAATMIYVVVPLLTEVLRAIDIPAFEQGMARVLSLPLSVRIVAVVTAGVVEDFLFIGYAFTRLAWLTGRNWLAGIISVAAAALLHLPNWGLGPVLAYLLTGAIATAFFVWRRDLVANMIAHFTVDAMGIVIVPVLLGSRAS